MRDHHEIRAVLPQRHPLLLVDRVLDVRPGRSITAVKAVTATEPCYRDVPDGAPAASYAYPAPLMLESLGQAAALLWLAGAETGAVGDDHVLMFAAARGYRVEAAAFPGDLLRHEVALDSVKADTVFASGETWVGDRRLAVAPVLIAVRRPRSTLGPTATPPVSTAPHLIRR